MDRRKFETAIARFQARARGHLVRGEVRGARDDFEEVVREIDGGLTNLKWVEAVVSIPRFTDTDGDPGLHASPAPLPEVEWVEAERDGSGACLPSSSVGGAGEGPGAAGGKDGGATELTGDSSSIWSGSELDVNCGRSHEGTQQYCLAQEVPRTPEALRLHRNTLTMEVLWLQQAIDSRKKYLSLKDRLRVS
ncbi:IQ domain-containing protein C isoform X2 [Embiotoca jacksoni]|uniref:IQ domain-containing protein C isoform X2 n=1 Tax=Embiotoca jacksoni TaxID=100190 RepID=UPI003704C661